MNKAASLTTKGHIAAMAMTQVGKNERDLDALLFHKLHGIMITLDLLFCDITRPSDHIGSEGRQCDNCLNEKTFMSVIFSKL